MNQKTNSFAKKLRHRIAKHVISPLRPWIPWLSLACGIATAFLMDRTPRFATWVAASAVLGWLGLGTILAFSQTQSKAKGLVPLLLSLGMQSWVQMVLFFSAPFYIQAMGLWAGYMVFLLVLVLALGVSLWDPLYYPTIRHPFFGPLLVAFSTFAALNCTLPMLGFRLSTSLVLAGAVAALSATAATLGGMFGARTKSNWTRQRQQIGVSALACLGMTAFWVLGAAHFVPPAPFRLVNSTLDTRGDPTNALICKTAVAAPLGLKSELVHIWYYDNVVTDRIPLRIEGGREEGYRTFSVKEHLGHDPAGPWKCAVQTSLGQPLGSAALQATL